MVYCEHCTHYNARVNRGNPAIPTIKAKTIAAVACLIVSWSGMLSREAAIKPPMVVDNMQSNTAFMVESFPVVNGPHQMLAMGEHDAPAGVSVTF